MNQSDVMSNAPTGLYIIKRQMRKDLTQRTQKDHEETKLRRRQYSMNYDKISQILDALFFGATRHKQLLDIAQIVSAKHKIQIDRLSKRSSECLICWYCKHWRTISPDIISYAKELFTSNAYNLTENDKDKIMIFAQALQQTNLIIQMNDFYEKIHLEHASPNFNSQIQDANYSFLPVPEISNTPGIIPQQQIKPCNSNKAKLPSIFEFAKSGPMPINLVPMPENSGTSNVQLENSIPAINHGLSNNVYNDKYCNINEVNNNNCEQLPCVPLRFKNFYLAQKRMKNDQTQFGDSIPLIND